MFDRLAVDAVVKAYPLAWNVVKGAPAKMHLERVNLLSYAGIGK